MTRRKWIIGAVVGLLLIGYDAQLLERYEGVDFAVVGEGEQPLARLRTDEVVVTTMSTTRPWGRLSDRDLDKVMVRGAAWVVSVWIWIAFLCGPLHPRVNRA